MTRRHEQFSDGFSLDGALYRWKASFAWVKDMPGFRIATRSMILLVALGAMLLLPMLTYSGLCLSEMRYLSDDEKVRLAVARVIEVQDSRRRVQTDAGSEGAISPEILSYRSVDEFLESNPHCCTVNDSGPEGIGPPTFLQRLLGVYSTVVELSI